MVYIPTGDIFILAKRVKHILVHGVNLDWHEGATLTGFSNTNKDELFITVARNAFLANIPVCTIVEKLKENSELSISEAGSAFILTYNDEQKSLSIKDNKVYLLNIADDSGIQIDIV